MNNKARIAELEEECRRLRKLGRTPREPVSGFGGVVQLARENAGVTLTGLAQAASVSKGLLSRVEQDADANPTLATMQALARGLSLPLSALLLRVETLTK